MKRIVAALLLAGLSASCFGQSLSGLCMVTSSQGSKYGGDAADLMLHSTPCGDEEKHGCGSQENSSLAWTRWTGVSADALKREGATLDGMLRGDAGELKCSGTVHDGVLAGRYTFTPSSAFVEKLHAMGFDDVTPNREEGMLMLDISAAWIQQMKDAGVTEMTTSHLMGLRALHVDLDYIHAMDAAGFPERRANKLTEMKAVGVTPQKARDAKEMGFNPSEQELVQMSIFKVDKPFVERMRARGLKDLTLHKLIQIKIFKLDE